jgi:hypothetical protein
VLSPPIVTELEVGYDVELNPVAMAAGAAITALTMTRHIVVKRTVTLTLIRFGAISIVIAVTLT